jgi:choline dehydrogenase-like flavoprotein
VREITVNEDGMANGAIYYDAEGVEHFQPAEMVVIACNGIGTPRLLLNSKSKKFPNGLANNNDQVGRNLMLHPYAMVFGNFNQRVIWSQEFYETDKSRGFVRGYTMEIVRGRGPLVTAMNGLNSGTIAWGESFHDSFGKQFAHTTGMVVICEDLPEAHNRVTLDPTLKDSDGIPAPKISYKLSENSLRMLDHAVARSTEVLKAAGAHTVNFESPWKAAGWHNMGTARMGLDPRTSVVNEWGRAHEVRNLFIIDGSIFTTSAGVNPTSTIQALALYIADSIKQRLETLFD